MTSRRSLGQRSRSDSDDHRNLVNPIAHKPLKGFEPQGQQYWAGRTPPPNNPPSNMAAAIFVVITNGE